MQTLKVVINFEWNQFKRTPVLAISLICFFIAGCYSIYYGNSVIRNQQSVIDSVQASYKKNYALQYKLISSDTTTQQGKSDHDMAGIPEVVNYRIAPTAAFYPKSLSGLSIGLRDVQSYYQIVKKEPQYIDQNAEINNPVKIAAGNFDLSFVIVYLLPLLIIGFCYNIISQEREKGTLSLILVQGLSVHKLIVYKLLFRGLLLGATLLLLNVAGAVVSSFTVKMNIGDILSWQYLSILYLALWLSIAYTVAVLRQVSIVNALYLLGIWLLFLIVLPALFNVIVSLRHPVPLQSGLASYQRELREHIWEMDRQALLDTFYENNPRYNNMKLPSDTSEYSSKRFVAFYDLLGRKMATRTEEVKAKLKLRAETESSLANYNPSVKLLQLFSAISGNTLADFENFRRSVNDFQLIWKDFLNSFLMYDKNLTLEDYNSLPRFHPKMEGISYPSVFLGSLPLWITMFVFLLLANYIKNHIQEN